MELVEVNTENNVSILKQFVLLGFSDFPGLQAFFSGVFTIVYLIILIGNSLIIMITRFDPALKKPMYFFLAHFSSMEICYVSIILPRVLLSIWTQDGTIYLLHCATQMCFFLVLSTAESLLLTVMSYDRYVAICNPFHYSLLLNPKKCVQLVIGSWLSGMPIQIGQTCQIFALDFCSSHQIDHFFCDMSLIIRLACVDTSLQELSVYVVVILAGGIPFILIIVSYSKIISTFLRLPKDKGPSKAFSTCFSYLMVVVLFYRSATITYLRPKSINSSTMERLLSLFYTVVTPMFNPLIYSLRNKEVIAALRKLFLGLGRLMK
ncbi:olfactory receptor 10AG1-like [Dipodomys merriami]|uniref:olfactory receptor 10AG1-like n=1 Tax=Dipodomys merriami TaxID=94247 RepID=UPI003855EED7